MSLDLDAVNADYEAWQKAHQAFDTDKWHFTADKLAGWVPDLLAALAAVEQDRDRLRAERDQAIAHDRQPYPTAWAYEQACKTIERMRPVVEAALAYRVLFGESTKGTSGEVKRLLDAIDVYESEVEAIAKEIAPAPLTGLIGIAPDRPETFEEAAAYLANETGEDLHGEDLDGGTEAGK